MREWIKKRPLTWVLAALLFGALFLATPVLVIVSAVKGKVKKVAGEEKSGFQKPADANQAAAKTGG